MEEDISKEMSSLNNKVEVESQDNEVMNYLVNYTGEKLNPENDEVTIGMIIDVLSQSFPELVLCLSEENWVRGYQQALSDVQEGERLYNEEISEKEKQSE